MLPPANRKQTFPLEFNKEFHCYLRVQKVFFALIDICEISVIAALCRNPCRHIKLIIILS